MSSHLITVLCKNIMLQAVSLKTKLYLLFEIIAVKVNKGTRTDIYIHMCVCVLLHNLLCMRCSFISLSIKYTPLQKY